MFQHFSPNDGEKMKQTTMKSIHLWKCKPRNFMAKPKFHRSGYSCGLLDPKSRPLHTIHRRPCTTHDAKVMRNKRLGRLM